MRIFRIIPASKSDPLQDESGVVARLSFRNPPKIQVLTLENQLEFFAEETMLPDLSVVPLGLYQ
jgi:hypothetical protein